MCVEQSASGSKQTWPVTLCECLQQTPFCAEPCRGELLRFMLALKVVLADKGHRPPKAATHSVTQILAIEGTSQTIGAPGSCDPRLGYELFAFAPSCGNRLLEPVSLQVRMIHDYDLEFRGKFRRCVGNELKQLQHRRLILVCQDVQRSFGVAFGRVVRLRRLVEDQEARNRATFLPEPLVKREVREHVIADPVFTASHSEQRHRTIQRVRDDCQIADVEAKIAPSMLQLKLFGIVAPIAADDVEERVQLLSDCVGVEFSLEHRDPRSPASTADRSVEALSALFTVSTY